MAEEEPAGEDPAGRMRAGYAKAEEKNQRAREALAPLDKGERPTVITIGAVFCAVMAAIAWSSAGVALLTGAEVAWWNAYHAQVEAVLAPQLSGAALDWLRQQCAPL